MGGERNTLNLLSVGIDLMRRRISLPSGWGAPAFLLLIAVVTFGLFIASLGFYWDDWAKLLVGRLYGLSHYTAYYAEDRPLSAWTHVLFTPLLGYQPVAWQAFNLLLRWLSAWAFYLVLGQIWPAARRQNLTAAVIFLLYPVFTQQAISVTFFQQWLQYALFFFSLLAMLKAVSTAGWRARGWMLASLAAMLAQFTVTEYFLPVELIRPVVLWLYFTNRPAEVMGETWRGHVVRVLKAWGPYLAGLAAYVVYRLFFLKLSGEDPYRVNTVYDFLQSPLQTAYKQIQIIIIDTWQIVIACWNELLDIRLDGVARFDWFALALGGVIGVLTGYILLRSAEPPEDGRRRWVRQALVLSLVAVMLGPVPAWITGRQVVFDFHSNRYAIPAMFGAGLLWTVIIEWLAQRRLQRAVLAGLLVALAVGLHLRTMNEYRWTWISQQRLYWQLAWRAPGLQPGTALFFETEPIPNQGLFSTSAAINLLYPQPADQEIDPSTGEPHLAYWVYALSPRYRHAPDSYEIGLSTQFRTLKYTGNTPNSLLLYNDTQVANCLWVLDPDDTESPYLTDLNLAFLPISNLDRILTIAEPGYPPVDMFGPEPERTWCYYFEKADLARQLKDWDEVVRLADTALEKGYSPDDSEANSPYEWMPFIEGYANTGDWAKAYELTIAAFKEDRSYTGMLCDLWNDGLEAWQGAGDENALQIWTEVQSAMQCSAVEE